MDEKELYGNLGEIDTPTERSAIEYRPKVKYEPNKTIIVNFPTEQNTSVDKENPLIHDDIEVELEEPAKRYEDFVSINTDLADMITSLEEELANIKIPISDSDISKIAHSFPSFDLSVFQQGTIDFGTYKKTFDDPENPGNSMLQDIVHSYAEDVDGSLELEFYEDLRELEQTVEEGYYLYKESVLKHYLGEGVPETPEKNDDFVKLLNDAVIQKKDNLKEKEKIYEANERKYYESLKTEYGSASFFKISDEYTKSKRPFDVAVREEKTVGDMNSLIKSFLVGSEDCSDRIKYGLVLGSDIDDKEVMKVLENQAETKEQLNELMKMSQISLKLQVNQQIENKKQYRDVLKNINNLPRKKRAHDELLTAVELRNKMYLAMYDKLQNLESPSKLPGVESFLNQVAGGLDVIQEQYDSFLQDVYLMYTSEYEVRKEKISTTLDKEDARAGYTLVSEHL